jgi:hypothetical protein
VARHGGVRVRAQARAPRDSSDEEGERRGMRRAAAAAGGGDGGGGGVGEGVRGRAMRHIVLWCASLLACV